MKRSKIFLGITTCLLAVAGVAATKRFGQSFQRWYCTIGNGTAQFCVPVPETCVTKLIGSNLKTCTVSYLVIGGFHHAPIYLVGAFTVGDNGFLPLPCDGLTNCINRIYYTRNN